MNAIKITLEIKKSKYLPYGKLQILSLKGLLSFSYHENLCNTNIETPITCLADSEIIYKHRDF